MAKGTVVGVLARKEISSKVSESILCDRIWGSLVLYKYKYEKGSRD